MIIRLLLSKSIHYGTFEYKNVFKTLLFQRLYKTVSSYFVVILTIPLTSVSIESIFCQNIGRLAL